jgi:Zn-dependent protease with chaperone function
MVAASAARPVSDATAAGTATILLVLAWGVLAKTAAWHAALRICRADGELTEIEDDFYRHLEIIRWSWLPAGFLAISAFGWSAVAKTVSDQTGSFALQAIVLMLPGLCVAAISWSCEFQWGKWLDDHFKLSHWQEKRLGDFVAASFRMQACWLLIPLLGVLIAWDALQVLVKSEIVPGAVLPLVVLLVPLLLPLAIRMSWRTRLLEEPWLSQLVLAAGIRHIPIRLWDTDMRVSTAVVVGALPFSRMLVLSDRLVQQLTRSELAMVILHELAHVKRFHLIFRVASLLPIWCFATAGYFLSDGDSTAHALTLEALPVQGMMVALGGVLTLIALRLISHLTEFDADATACRMAVVLAGEVDGLPCSLPWAARELHSALERITGGEANSHKSSWMHPKIADRLIRLNKINSPEIIRGSCPKPLY